MGQIKYRRKVYCKNCGINQDLEFDYKEEICCAKCPRCGCKTLELRSNKTNEEDKKILKEFWDEDDYGKEI